MQLEKHDTYAIFTLSVESNEGWTLYVIDDYWESAIDMFEDVGYPFSSEKIENFLDIFISGGAGSQRTAIGMMPVWSETLDGLSKLVIGDFKRLEKSSESVDYCVDLAIQEYQNNKDIAFLIDLSDPTIKNAGENNWKLLEAKGVPDWRCAFLTIGRRTDAKLEKILKDALMDGDGKQLREWWARVRGKIDSSLFERETTPKNAWHNPGELEEALKEKDFLTFVEDQADRDTYGVWMWVLKTLKIAQAQSLSLEHQYTYLCGKAFLKMPERVCIPFTALRGLVFGLCRGQRSAEVVEPNYQIPQGSNIDNIFCWGEYTTGKDSLENLAKALRNWFEKLEGQPGGTAKLSQAQINRTEESCEIEFRLTDYLTLKVFDGTGGGTVTRTWTEVANCFSSENKPVVLDNGKAVRLIFPSCISE